MKLMTQAGIAVLIFLGGVALLMIMVAGEDKPVRYTRRTSGGLHSDLQPPRRRRL